MFSVSLITKYQKNEILIIFIFIFSVFFLVIFFTGSHISGVSWYMEILGASTGTVTFGYDGVQRVVCRSRYRNANVRNFNRMDRLAGPILLLRPCRCHVVPVLAVAIVRETQTASKYFSARAEIHRKIVRRFCTNCHAYNINDPVAPFFHFDARLCNYCCEFLPLLELLFARFVSKCIS